jgi:3-oxoacyl-[acyl-carrier-protein] synthase III
MTVPAMTMTSRPLAYLRGVSYELGEQEVGYADIPGLPELAAKYGLAPSPGLWGWGSVRATSRDLADLAAACGRATLRAAGTPAGSVDALVLCSTRVPVPADNHGIFLARVLDGAGLGDIPCYGQTLNRCLNLLTALDVARALVLSGRHGRVLVITADAVAGGTPMSQFALYSDAAAGCLLAADPGPQGCYEILGCASAQDTTAMDPASQISSDLAREVNDRLLEPPGLKLGDVAALAHLNLFRPLLVMKERQAGFSEDQLYLDNIQRTGHCFAADPLINLADLAARGRVGQGHYCLLAASVPGCRAGVLLRRVC